MRRFHVVIFHKALMVNSLFCVLTEEWGSSWHEEYVNNCV
jgi:hypothetical protein